MGTKSEKFLFEYKITNNKTGETFQARGWRNVCKLAGLKSYNATNLNKTKKWSVVVTAEPEEWDESAYRSTLYEKTKDRYAEYENRKQLKDPLYERRKKLRLGGYKNLDGSQFTAEQHEAMRRAPCQVCGETDLTKLKVDHCHKTGIVRGTLCHHCNIALGHLRDSPSTIKKLLEYAQHHQEIIENVWKE